MENKPETRGAPKKEDGLTKDQRYRRKNKKVFLLEPIEGSAQDKDDLKPSLQVIEKHHTTRKAGVIAAITHYAKYLEGKN